MSDVPPPPPGPPLPAMPPLVTDPVPRPTYPDEPPQRWPTPVPPPARPGAGGPTPPHPGAGPGGRPGGGEGPARGLMVAAVLAVIATVVAAVLLVSTGGDDDRDTARRTPSSVPPSTSDQDRSDPAGAAPDSSEGSSSSSEDEDLATVVEDLKRFVERERGLPFLAPVSPRLAGEGEFQELLLEDFDELEPEIAELGQVLTALDLVAPGTDVVADYRALLDIGVVGFYDPETDDLVVRGTGTGPYVRQVLVHELTHALEDQHFDLDRPQLDTADDETGVGFGALVEGSARIIEDRYADTLTAAEQARSFEEQFDLLDISPDLLLLPQVLLNLLEWPYSQGPELVGAILADGGQARLDAAYPAPPTTTEQASHPAKYLAGEGAAALPFPASDVGAAAEQGALGQLLISYLLDDVAGAEAAVEGWGGDRYVTWTDGQGRTCLRGAVVGDTAQDTAELAAALDRWATASGATVEAPADGPVTFTSCR